MGRLPDSGLPQDRAGRACRAGHDPVRIPDAKGAGFRTPGSPPRSSRPTAPTAISTRLSGRIAQIRTWTFVANRPDWLADPEHWQGITREVENKLSDALHERLTERFVDRRTSVLMRRLRENTMLNTEIGKTGEVIVEGHVIGRLDGFTFAPTRRKPAPTPRRCRRPRRRRWPARSMRAPKSWRSAGRPVRADLRRHHPLDRRRRRQADRGRRRAASAPAHHCRRAADRRRRARRCRRGSICG